MFNKGGNWKLEGLEAAQSQKTDAEVETEHRSKVRVLGFHDRAVCGLPLWGMNSGNIAEAYDEPGALLGTVEDGNVESLASRNPNQVNWKVFMLVSVLTSPVV